MDPVISFAFISALIGGFCPQAHALHSPRLFFDPFRDKCPQDLSQVLGVVVFGAKFFVRFDLISRLSDSCPLGIRGVFRVFPVLY